MKNFSYTLLDYNTSTRYKVGKSKSGKLTIDGRVVREVIVRLSNAWACEVRTKGHKYLFVKDEFRDRLKIMGIDVNITWIS